MISWAIFIHVNCTAPRIEFREFYSQTTGAPWPGSTGETFEAINRRLADAMANYIDYAEAHRDQCGVRR